MCKVQDPEQILKLKTVALPFGGGQRLHVSTSQHHADQQICTKTRPANMVDVSSNSLLLLLQTANKCKTYLPPFRT